MSRVLRSVLVAFAALAIILSASFVSAQEDRPGSKDYPGIPRMPGYVITGYEDSQFDSYSFKVTQGTSEKQQTVEGHRYFFRYEAGSGGAGNTTALQIVRNYQNAARAAGGQVLRDAGGNDDRETTLRLVKDGSELWIAIGTTGRAPSHYVMYIVAKQAMHQEVTLDASAMASDIGSAGRVAVYGIHFDTGSSELKGDSEPALVEITKLLDRNPTLRVYVVGHTDMTASLATNVQLSQARAQSVVNALAGKHGIAASRLIPFGAGPYAPVASNRTEEGRAKNRRVELVEIAVK